MRKIEEQMAEIKLREGAARRKRTGLRVAVLSGLSCAACLCLIVALARVLPALGPGTGRGPTPGYYATAVFGSPMAGYVVIVTLAFALGVCVTLLCVALRRRKDGRDDK